MKLPGYFMSITDRTMGTQNPLQIYLNASVITSNEFEEIKQWCNVNDCRYSLVGLVEFPDDQSKTLFLLRWT